MAANNDNAMTRFLFAILKQKCLKDIDWNQVAHDPILAQEITNGHAARMRYSRFRSAMLGTEPQRRNRPATTTKSKVTKSKKEPSKAKKEESVKQDPAMEAAGSLDEVPKTEPAKVKEEMPYPPPSEEPRPTSDPAAPVTMPNTYTRLPGRLLTPCSESELLAVPQGYAGSPTGELLQSEASFDFAGAAQCNHDHESWPQNLPYQPFGMAYDLDGYAAGFCEHQHDHEVHLHDHQQQQHHHHHHHQQHLQSPQHVEELCVPSAVMKPDLGHVNIKHEEWDAHYHEM